MKDALTEGTPSEAAAMALVMETLHKPTTVSLSPSSSPSVIVAPQGMELHSVKELLKEFEKRPERRSGTAQIKDVQSLIGYLNRFKSPETVVFANPDAKAPALTAVLNYHPENQNTADAVAVAAGFGDHKAHYAIPLSDEWKAWAAQNEKGMSQIDFARFIEDRVADLIPVMDDHQALMQLAAQIGGGFASPSQLLALSRGLQVSNKVEVQSAVTLSTGEIKVAYSDNQTPSVEVPSLFAIAIPVFYNGVAYRIAVRLRYRLVEKAVQWSYALYRTDRVFDDAFKEVLNLVAQGADVPIIVGAPEK